MTIQAVLNSERTWHVETTDVLAGLRSMPDGCVHCCVTSPPYWMLRDYGVPGQLGMEDTPEEFIANMVAVFAEVRRVLRDDGTLWLNIGDSYCNDAKGPRGTDKSGLTSGVGYQNSASPPRMQKQWRRTGNLKRKDLVGIPWMLAFALRADGWYLRSDIIWHKPGPMPGSQKDRPTKAHEYIFLLTKRPVYFYDEIASSEKATGKPAGNKTNKYTTAYENGAKEHRTKAGLLAYEAVSTRYARSVWKISSEPFKESHFAVFPTKLVHKCLLAGTSEQGCCRTCGAPYARLIEKVRIATRPGTASKVHRNGKAVDRQSGATVECHNKPWAANGIEVGNRDPQRHVTIKKTVGWKPSCDCCVKCDGKEPCNGHPVPSLNLVRPIVLDPFNGAGTTGVVARRMQLRYIGLELKPEYADMARRRIRDDAPLLNAS